MALIATADRAELLGSRSLPSILGQTCPADRIVVVDDSRDPKQSRRVKALVENHDVRRIDFLYNRRTRGASGAWNTGLDHLARSYPIPEQVYVAILDDDDVWRPNHLVQVWKGLNAGAQIIATPFLRIVGDKEQVVMPPDTLEAASFLVGNPGIQASNLIVRLDLFLQAGMYDEALTSCTDRDLLIRLARLNRGGYFKTLKCSVRHFACPDRQRLCTPGASARVDGLNAFFSKWRLHMSEEQRMAAEHRAQRYFSWNPSEAVVTGQPPMLRESKKRESSDTTFAGIHLIVGLILDDRRVQGLTDLFDDFMALRSEPGLLNLDCVLLENCNAPEPQAMLGVQVENVRRRGLRIHLINRRDQIGAARARELDLSDRDLSFRLPIASARTALQTYLYHFASSRRDAVVWIIDDDMRLNPMVESKSTGRIVRRWVPLLPQLQAMRTHGVDIAIGRYTGAAPLPVSATVRVQLVDLLFNLRRLARMASDDVLVAGIQRNVQLRRDRRDYYYDLSHAWTDHLETPFVFEPVHPRETVSEALVRLVRRAPRILAGEQVFRPLVVSEPESANPTWNTSFYRGGNCFVLDPAVLRDAPNLAPTIGGRSTRRSDMIWALVQKTLLGRRVESVSIAVYHDRSNLAVPDRLDVDGIADDLRGYAVFMALQHHMSSGHGAVDDRSEKYLEERLAAFRLSFHRIRGLGFELQALARSESGLSGHVNELQSLARRILDLYQPEVLLRIERVARILRGTDVAAFAKQIPGLLSEHRARMDRAKCVRSQLARERVVNARATVVTMIPDISLPLPLKFLGQGDEGVALTDGRRVYKVFDYWNAADAERTRTLLDQCVGRWPAGQSLYPLLAWKQSRTGKVLCYPYEESKPYQGGLGPGLVNLMVECHRVGLICRNIHPKNLRRVGHCVKLIDYGSDLLMPSDSETFEREFSAMCRRAFLSWRWWRREDLESLLRQSISDTDMPELTGCAFFMQAVYQVLGLRGSRDPVWERAEALASNGVLDYGCGKGALARHLAGRGARVVAFDPDRDLEARLLTISDSNLVPVFTVAEALKQGPFDLVVCRRVACLVDDDALITLLRNLRKAVAPGGRVLFGLCHPVYTPICTTPEATPIDGVKVDSEAQFTWKKALRINGRVLTEAHRPEHRLRRLLRRMGLAVVSRYERESVDMERFEPIADLLVYELEPVELPRASLLIKACAMEADTLEIQVRHLVRNLEFPAGFAEITLSLDSKSDVYLRQHARSNPQALMKAANRLEAQGWVDRIIRGPSSGKDAKSLNHRWFGLNTEATHAANGAQLVSILAGFEACTTRYLLHVDLDVMVGRRNLDHDYLSDMLEVLEKDENAVTVAFNIAHAADRPYSAEGPFGSWRVESRISLIDLSRLCSLRPLSNELVGDRPKFPWHRALDLAVQQGRATSWRGGSCQSLFVHPQNERKYDQDAWFITMNQLERGYVPLCQQGHVDWVGDRDDWLLPERYEPFVFIIAGRNVSPERFRRCLDSVLAQQRRDWGAVIIDDASTCTWADEIEAICRPHMGHISLLCRYRRRGLLANMAEAIRYLCGNPDSVILTLDADDCLVGNDVLDEINRRYVKGADVTVGSMLRTDKHQRYPATLKNPRCVRGGNVWQHLRTFRKRLFDAIPHRELHIDGKYVDLATDWAYMLPIVEMAKQPEYIERVLYLHEPGGPRGARVKRQREAIIKKLISRPPLEAMVGGCD